MDTISQTLQRLPVMMNSEIQTPPERWRKILPYLRKDMEDFGIDYNEPKNWIVYIAKTITREAKKGILLMGTTGTGKTKRLRFLNHIKGITMINAFDVGDLWKQCGDDENAFREIFRCNPPVWDEVDRSYNDLILDDLGTEQEKYTCYGESRDVMRDKVLMLRYNVFVDRGYKTHITTNLTEDQLLKRYGERVYSRLSEMCAFVSLNGKDRRLSK